MGNKQRGDPQFPLQALDLITDLGAHRSIKSRQRFIQQQHRRLNGQSSGKCDSLLLTTGQLMRETLTKRAKAAHFQQLLCAATALAPANATNTQTVFDIV